MVFAESVMCIALCVVAIAALCFGIAATAYFLKESVRDRDVWFALISGFGLAAFAASLAVVVMALAGVVG